MTIVDSSAEAMSRWLQGSHKLDGLILVVNVLDGPMPYTRSHLELASGAGIKPIALWFNKVDAFTRGPGLLEVIEMETRDLLSSYGFEDENVPAAYGSSLWALAEIETGKQGVWTSKLTELWTGAQNYASHTASKMR